MRKLNEQQISEIKEKYEKGGISHRELSAEYGVSRTTINRILNPDYAQKERESNRERARAGWKSSPIKKYFFNLHTTNDADIINKLDSEQNRQGYIKSLIRKDIEENK